MGFIRIMLYAKETESNIICADFVTNATLAVIWNKSNEIERCFELATLKKKFNRQFSNRLRLESNEQSIYDDDTSDTIYHVTAKKETLTYRNQKIFRWNWHDGRWWNTKFRYNTSDIYSVLSYNCQSNSQLWNKNVFSGQINTTMREMFEEYPSCNAL